MPKPPKEQLLGIVEPSDNTNCHNAGKRVYINEVATVSALEASKEYDRVF